MNDIVWAALIAALPPVITIVLSNRAQNKKTDLVVRKVDEVHALANNRLSEALKKIEDLTIRLDRLKR